jgi:hypothetical protein
MNDRGSIPVKDYFITSPCKETFIPCRNLPSNISRAPFIQGLSRPEG